MRIELRSPYAIDRERVRRREDRLAAASLALICGDDQLDDMNIKT